MQTIDHPAGTAAGYHCEPSPSNPIVVESTPKHLRQTLTLSTDGDTLVIVGGVAGAVYRVAYRPDAVVTVRAVQPAEARKDSGQAASVSGILRA